MNRILITILIAFCFATISIAKDYGTGIGLRGGSFTGHTVMHFVSEKSAFEFGVHAGFWADGVAISIRYIF